MDFSNYKDRPTDADLAQLESIVGLGSLDLSGTPVTDAGLTHLAGLKKLYRIDLRRTRVTPAGVAELQRALPDTHIDVTNAPPVVPPPPPRGGNR